VERGCAAFFSGVDTLLFTATTVLLVALSISAGKLLPALVALGVGGGFSAAFGFLTWRWARGHDPTAAVPDPHPDEIKRLAAELAQEEDGS
jgi:hypothetical protein